MMQNITKLDFDSVLVDDTYYKGRWFYFEKVLWLIDSLKLKPQRVIEIGPYKLPIYPECDTIDVKSELNPTFCFDARKTPWKIDKKYDLLIGLQVFEHLQPRCSEAFKEMEKLADHIILSVPYMWVDDDIDHSHIDERLIKSWARTPDTTVLCKNKKSKTRLICYWNNVI